MASNRYINTSTASYADTGDTVFSMPYAYSLDDVGTLPSILSSGTGPR